jgi:hypothetical protein
MAHGSRGRWLRAVAAGCGALIGTTLIGCQNTDKYKDTKTLPKQPITGTLPPSSTGAMNKSTGTTYPPLAGGNLVQQGGGTYNTMPRVGTTGANTLTGGPQQPINYTSQPGGGTPIGAPAMPGIQQTQPIQPTGGIGAPVSSSGVMNNPPAPSLATIQPPPPPDYGQNSAQLGGGGVPPPQALAPLSPQAPSVPGRTSFGSGGAP